MALVKTVEMRILADAGDAQKKLDEMDAKAKDLDSKAIRMRFRLDSEEGKRQLDEIKAKADLLGYKDVEIKVRVDGKGRAVADLMALKHEEDKLARTSVEGGLLSRLIGGRFNPGGTGGLLGSVPEVGASPGMLGGIAAAVPLVGGLAVELLGVASGFAAAGAGAGAFYALARPAIKNLQGDYKSLTSAQQAYQLAQEKAALSPTKANLKSEADALLKLRAVRKGMTADEAGAAGGISRLSAEYRKMTQAFAPQVFKVFNDGLKVAGSLLPHLAPFANTFASGLDKLLQQLGKFTQSKGFQQWLNQFHSLEGPAIQAIGHGIGQVANSFGKLLTVMSGKDVGRAIGIAFGAISGTINVVAGGIRRFMSNFDGMKSAATSAVRGIVSAFKSLASNAAADFGAVVSIYRTMIHGIVTGVSTVISAVGSLPGKIKGFFAGAAGWLVNAGRAVIDGLIHGIESGIGKLGSVLGGIVGFIAAHKGPIEKDRLLLVPHGQAVMDGLISGIQSRLPALEAAARKAAALIAARIKAEISFAKGVTASTMSGLGLTSIDLSQGTVATGMQSYLTSIKSFIADLKTLSAQHLNKALLRQLIAAGPVTGDQYAQSILTGGGAGQVNSIYRQIQQQAVLLGAQAAQSVYGGKVTPGRGDTLDVKVDVRLVTGKQAMALEIVKVLKEYKRHGGNVPLGIG